MPVPLPDLPRPIKRPETRSARYQPDVTLVFLDIPEWMKREPDGISATPSDRNGL